MMCPKCHGKRTVPIKEDDPFRKHVEAQFGFISASYRVIELCCDQCHGEGSIYCCEGAYRETKTEHELAK